MTGQRLSQILPRAEPTLNLNTSSKKGSEGPRKPLGDSEPTDEAAPSKSIIYRSAGRSFASRDRSAGSDTRPNQTNTYFFQYDCQNKVPSGNCCGRVTVTCDMCFAQIEPLPASPMEISCNNPLSRSEVARRAILITCGNGSLEALRERTGATSRADNHMVRYPPPAREEVDKYMYRPLPPTPTASVGEQAVPI